MTLEHIKQKFASTPLSKWFFYALVFLLPIGTKKIFFTSLSFYYGYFSFYNSFYLYLTDLIFLGLMLAWAFERFYAPSSSPPNLGGARRGIDGLYLFLAAFWLILAISTLLSRESSLSFYGLAKITQYLLIFVYIRENISLSRESQRVFWLILAISVLESTLAIAQYIFQTSFGLKILGEEFLRPGLPGIAEFLSRESFNPLIYHFLPYLRQNLDIFTLMRGYGTLPHPNILSGVLFVGLMINLYMLYTPSSSLPKLGGARRGILCATLILICAGLMVTFSRGTWAVAAAGIIVWFLVIFLKIRKAHIFSMRTGQLSRESLQESYDPKALGIVILALLIAISVNLFLFGGPIRARLLDKGKSTTFVSQESLQNRHLYNQLAGRMIFRHTVFGVGLKNFVVNMDDYSRQRLLPYIHQPAHNIYLLIAAESGLLALAIFCVVICNIVRHWWKSQTEPVLKYSLLIVLGGLLTIGLFDHYLWTIEAGSLLFWIMLGLLANKKMEAEKPPLHY